MHFPPLLHDVRTGSVQIRSLATTTPECMLLALRSSVDLAETTIHTLVTPTSTLNYDCKTTSIRMHVSHVLLPHICCPTRSSSTSSSRVQAARDDGLVCFCLLFPVVGATTEAPRPQSASPLKRAVYYCLQERHSISPRPPTCEWGGVRV